VLYVVRVSAKGRQTISPMTSVGFERSVCSVPSATLCVTSIWLNHWALCLRSMDFSSACAAKQTPEDSDNRVGVRVDSAASTSAFQPGCQLQMQMQGHPT